MVHASDREPQKYIGQEGGRRLPVLYIIWCALDFLFSFGRAAAPGLTAPFTAWDLRPDLLSTVVLSITSDHVATAFLNFLTDSKTQAILDWLAVRGNLITERHCAAGVVPF